MLKRQEGLEVRDQFLYLFLCTVTRVRFLHAIALLAKRLSLQERSVD